MSVRTSNSVVSNVIWRCNISNADNNNIYKKENQDYKNQKTASLPLCPRIIIRKINPDIQA